MVLESSPPGAFIVDCTEKVAETLDLVKKLCEERGGYEVSSFREDDSLAAKAVMTVGGI
jgi:hypothetical protein